MYGYKVETVANVTYPDEKVNEKEYIEGQIHLLSGTVCPRSAGLHRLPIGINRIRIQTGQSIRHQFIKEGIICIHTVTVKWTPPSLLFSNILDLEITLFKLWNMKCNRSIRTLTILRIHCISEILPKENH